MPISIYSFKDKVHQHVGNCLIHSRKSVNLNIFFNFNRLQRRKKWITQILNLKDIRNKQKLRNYEVLIVFRQSMRNARLITITLSQKCPIEIYSWNKPQYVLNLNHDFSASALLTLWPRSFSEALQILQHHCWPLLTRSQQHPLPPRCKKTKYVAKCVLGNKTTIS